MEIYPFLARGVFQTFCYFVIDERTRHGFLIDCGAQADDMVAAVREQGWSIEAILLTHGHFDHTAAVPAVRAALGCPVLIHAKGERYLHDPQLNLSAGHGLNVIVDADGHFADGEMLALAEGEVALRVMHIPGHTDDSCLFYGEDAGVAFVGDTVYGDGPGLTVFPTGDARKIQTSIRERILTMPGDVQLLSGHGRPIAVDRLRANMG
ncbi:MAG: MBL fold metallo-hydrolase [Coriobacteriales bacterium]|jgi:hydroxyacylglutathione hydrolase